jgi:hypothetical protein
MQALAEPLLADAHQVFARKRRNPAVWLASIVSGLSVFGVGLAVVLALLLVGVA